MDSQVLKVLLIEDDLIDQMAFKRAVNEQGLPYRYVMAGSINEAREILDNCSFDIVLCDFSLGDGTLFDILDDIIKKGIPLIVTTGNGDEETAVKAIKGGADDYIIKDLGRNYLKILATRVNKALDNRKLLLEREQAEKALHASEELYRTLIETSPNGIGMTDLDGKLVMVNQPLLSMFGYEHISDITGTHAVDYVSPYELSAYQELKKALLEGRVSRHELTVIKKDGSHFLAEISTSPVHDESGMPHGFMIVIADITDRFRVIFNTVATAMMIVEEDHTISQVNAEFERMSGYPKNDIEGIKYGTDFFLADNIAEIKKYHAIRRIDEAAAPRNYESCFVNRDGQIINVLMTVSMIPQTQKSIIAIMDISSRKQMETDLRHSQQKYRNLVENINDCIWETDHDFICTYISPRFYEILGYQPAEVIGTSLFDYLFLQEKAALNNIASKQVFDAKESLFIEGILVHKLGHSVNAKTSVSRILESDGSVAGYTGILHDITEELRLRKEKQQLQEQSARMSKLMSISAMSAGIVHEIGQPLNALQVLVDSMLYWRERGINLAEDKIYANMERISTQVGRIDDIIKHMRSFVSAGNLTELNSCNLNCTIERVLDILGSQLSAHGIIVITNLQKDLKSIWGSSISLEEMLINLLVNSLNALDTCQIADKKISLLTQMMDEWVVLQVADNATGIADDLKNTIFEPF
ncbi:MAG: PAS domain S-box protein [Syntrophomonadaceae bacterium]|nr:PAS domain S-box protein [Syntrophomonadaceae bacterium]